MDSPQLASAERAGERERERERERESRNNSVKERLTARCYMEVCRGHVDAMPHLDSGHQLRERAKEKKPAVISR
jgi:hypothetical protein